MQFIAAAIAALLSLVQPQSASNSKPDPDIRALADNAALVYWQYWAVISPDQREKIPDPAKEGEDWTPSEADRALLTDLKTAIAGIGRAAEMPRCNFGNQQEHWPDSIATHLGLVRLSSRLLATDARQCESDHDLDGSVIRVSWMLSLSRHASTEGWEIHRLVGLATLETAMRETRRLLSHGQLSGDQVRRLQKLFKEVETPDILAGIRLEIKDFDAWARPQPRLSLRELIKAEPGPLDLVVDGPKAADDMLELLKKYEEAWGQPDAPARLEVITQEAGDKKLGVVPSLMMPNATDGLRFEQSSKKKLDEMRAELDKRVKALEEAGSKK